jgi:hypothetical protein
MKNLYQILYGMAGLLLLIVLLGGSITKPMFNDFSVKTLEASGIKRAAMDSLDSRVDDMLHTVSKVQLQIEKLKNIFSSKEIDESKYVRTKNEVFVRNIYNPLNELIIVFYRIGFFFLAVMLLLCGVIFQLIYRSVDLRRRVTLLEKAMYRPGNN